MLKTQSNETELVLLIFFSTSQYLAINTERVVRPRCKLKNESVLSRTTKVIEAYTCLLDKKNSIKLLTTRTIFVSVYNILPSFFHKPYDLLTVAYCSSLFQYNLLNRFFVSKGKDA